MTDPVGSQLYKAAQSGLVSDVSSLLRDHLGLNVNWQDNTQWTALHTACWNGHADVAKLLLAHPAIKVNLKTHRDLTGFSYACVRGRVSVVQVLKDPRVDITLDDHRGCTPLW